MQKYSYLTLRPYLQAVKQGRDVLLTYDAVLVDAILKACSDDDSEAI